MGVGDDSPKTTHDGVHYSALCGGADHANGANNDFPLKERGGSIPNGDAGNTDKLASNVDTPSVEEYEPLDQAQFDDTYIAVKRPNGKTIRESYKDMKRDCKRDCSAKCVMKKITGLVPFLKIPQYYNIREDFLNDMISGLTVGIMQIPMGMAYATLASLPPEYGLYTSVWPIFMYAFLGSSRHASVGTFAVISLMVGSTVDRFDCEGQYGDGNTGGVATTMETYAGNWTENMTTISTIGGGSTESNEVTMCKVGVALAVTFMGGIFQLLMGIARLGFVTIYLSEAMTMGFTTGCSIHVFSSQVKSIFGVPVGSYYGPGKLIYLYRDIIMNITQTNIATLVTSIICIVILLITKEFINPFVKKKIKTPIPIDLIVVIVGTVISTLFDFEERFGMAIVGYIPTGVPAPVFPDPKTLVQVIGDGLAVAIVAFAISVSMAQIFAKRHNYEYDSNQELIAHGATNLVCACLNCYMECVSLSRSVVAEALGCKSQINSLWSGSLMLLVIVTIASYFQPLPNCILASIVVVALKGMFMQFTGLPRYWRVNKVDFAVWMVAFVSVVLLDVALGLVVGIAFSIITVVKNTQRPYCAIEGQVEGTDIYKDVAVYPKKTHELDGIKIFRFDGSIYFANTQFFIDSIYEKTDCDARKIRIRRGKLERKIKKETSEIKKAERKMERAKEEGPRKADLDLEDPRKADLDLEDPRKAEGRRKADLDLEKRKPETVMPMLSIHHLIIDCTTMGYLDDAGTQCVGQVCSDYKDIGVTVFLAGCKVGIRETLEKGGFHEKFDKDIMFPTVHIAVLAASKTPEFHTKEFENEIHSTVVV